MIQYTIVQYITVLCSIHRTQTLLSSSLCSHEQLVCKVDETNTPLKGYLFQQVHLVNCFIAMTPFKAQGGPFWTGQSHHKTSTNTTFQNIKIKRETCSRTGHTTGLMSQRETQQFIKGVGFQVGHGRLRDLTHVTKMWCRSLQTKPFLLSPDAKGLVRRSASFS